MLPTLCPGEVLLCRRYRRGEHPRTGELVIVRHGSGPAWLVKRVVASPGEALPEALSEDRSPLPPGRYFLGADNPAPAAARRWLAPVGEEEICAQVRLVLWPWRRWRRPK